MAITVSFPFSSSCISVLPATVWEAWTCPQNAFPSLAQQGVEPELLQNSGSQMPCRSSHPNCAYLTVRSVNGAATFAKLEMKHLKNCDDSRKLGIPWSVRAWAMNLISSTLLYTPSCHFLQINMARNSIPPLENFNFNKDVNNAFSYFR